MGYSNTIPYQQLSIKSEIKTADVLVASTGGSSSYAFVHIVIPVLRFAPSHVFVDFHAQTTSDSSGGANYLLASGYVSATESGYYRRCASIHNGDFLTPASTWQIAHYVIPGNTNISQYIAHGNFTSSIELETVQAQGDFLAIGRVWAEMRLYFGVD